MSQKTSRRELLRNLSLAGAALSVFPFTAFAGKVETVCNDSLLNPFTLLPKEPLVAGPTGASLRTWVRSGQTKMQYSCVEVAFAPKKMGPAPHVHKDLDELMYVVEGTASVMVDGKLHEVPAGGWNFRPRQMEHTFFNASDQPLRFFDMYFNQNFEDFLEELFHKIFPEMAKAGLTTEDPSIKKRIEALHAKFGIVMYHEKRMPLIQKYGLIA